MSSTPNEGTPMSETLQGWRSPYLDPDYNDRMDEADRKLADVIDTDAKEETIVIEDEIHWTITLTIMTASIFVIPMGIVLGYTVFS